MTKLTLIVCNDDAVPARYADVHDSAWVAAVRAVALASGATVDAKLNRLAAVHAELLSEHGEAGAAKAFIKRELHSIAELDAVGIVLSPTDEDGALKLYAALYSPDKLRAHRNILPGITSERLKGMHLT